MAEERFTVLPPAPPMTLQLEEKDGAMEAPLDTWQYTHQEFVSQPPLPPQQPQAPLVIPPQPEVGWFRRLIYKLLPPPEPAWPMLPPLPPLPEIPAPVFRAVTVDFSAHVRFPEVLPHYPKMVFYARQAVRSPVEEE